MELSRLPNPPKKQLYSKEIQSYSSAPRTISISFPNPTPRPRLPTSVEYHNSGSLHPQTEVMLGQSWKHRNRPFCPSAKSCRELKIISQEIIIRDGSVGDVQKFVAPLKQTSCFFRYTIFNPHTWPEFKTTNELNCFTLPEKS